MYTSFFTHNINFIVHKSYPADTWWLTVQVLFNSLETKGYKEFNDAHVCTLSNYSTLNRDIIFMLCLRSFKSKNTIYNCSLVYRCFCAHSKYMFIGIMITTHNIGSNWHIFQSQDRIYLITFYYKKSCDASNGISKSSNVG